MLFSALTINAQTKVWDMGTNTTLWPALSPNMTSGQVDVDGLTIVSGGGTFGATSARVLTWTDGYVSAQEFKSNGSSSGGALVPTTRYFTFPVTGPTTVKVWFRVNGTGGRKCIISDGVTLLGEMTSEDSNAPLLLSVNYTGGAGNIYVTSLQSINYFKIEATTTPLGLDTKSVVTTKVHAAGSRIYVSNVKSKTQVDVFSMTGALVKSLKTENDTDFDLKTGVYIVSAKSADGEKSVKVIIQ